MYIDLFQHPSVLAHRAPDPVPVDQPAPEPFSNPHPHHPPVPQPQDDPVPDHKPSLVKGPGIKYIKCRVGAGLELQGDLRIEFVAQLDQAGRRARPLFKAQVSPL